MRRPVWLAVAFALALLLPGAAGQDEAGAAQQGQREEVAQDWSEEARQVNAVQDALGFHFESERRTDLGRDQLLGQFDIARARMTYEYISTEPGNETILRMHLDFVALVEFEDVDADGRFGLGDNVVQRIALAGHSGAGMDTGHPVCAPASGECTATVRIPLNATQDPGGLPIGSPTVPLGGTMDLTFHMLSQKRVLGSSVIPPTQTKFDIAIQDFPYANEDGQNNTHLALETRLASSQPLDTTDRDTRTETRPFVAFYGWTGHATAGGVSAPVGVTLLHDASTGSAAPGNQSVTVVYTYSAAQSIRHDPSLGVVRYRTLAGPADIVEALFKGDWRIYGAAFVLAASVVAASAAYRLRRG